MSQVYPIQEERFADPWAFALVLEPLKHYGGFFCWRDGKVNPNEPVEFYELLGRNSRDSVVAWHNYRGVDLSTEGPPALGALNTKVLGSKEPEDGGSGPGSGLLAPQLTRPVEGPRPPQKPPVNSHLATTAVVVSLALLLGFLVVWGVSRRAGRTTADTPGTGAVVSAETSPTAVPAELEETPPLEIDPGSFSYQRVGEGKGLLEVSFLVNNAPYEPLVKLSGRTAEVTGYTAEGDEKKSRRVTATVGIDPIIEDAKRNKGESVRLSVEVGDKDNPKENFDRRNIPIELAKLGVSGRNEQQNDKPVTVKLNDVMPEARTTARTVLSRRRELAPERTQRKGNERPDAGSRRPAGKKETDSKPAAQQAGESAQSGTDAPADAGTQPKKDAKKDGKKKSGDCGVVARAKAAIGMGKCGP